MDTEKEKLLKVYPNPISITQTKIILEQMKENICKIYLKDGGNGTGFFCEIPFPDEDNLLSVLITNNHVINETYLNEEQKIVVSINNIGNEIIRKIELTNKKKYTNKDYDITIIEINEDKEQINNFLKLDSKIMSENCEDTFVGNSIYTIGYPNDEEVKVSYGILKSRELDNEFGFIHLCSTESGSSGSPILNLKNNKVIGIHKECSKNFNFNKGSFLKLSIQEFISKNLNNNNIINNNINKNENNKIKKIIVFIMAIYLIIQKIKIFYHQF